MLHVGRSDNGIAEFTTEIGDRSHAESAVGLRWVEVRRLAGGAC